MNNIESNGKKEKELNMKEFKVNINVHMRLTNSVKETEIASLPLTVLKLSLTNSMIEISANSRHTLMT
jgi:hypothetical protein